MNTIDRKRDFFSPRLDTIGAKRKPEGYVSDIFFFYASSRSPLLHLISFFPLSHFFFYSHGDNSILRIMKIRLKFKILYLHYKLIFKYLYLLTNTKHITFIVKINIWTQLNGTILLKTYQRIQKTNYKRIIFSFVITE